MQTYTVHEAAEHLGVTVAAIYAAIFRGKLESTRTDDGKPGLPRHLIAAEELERYRESRYPGRLTADDVRTIRRLYAAGGITQKALGDKFGVTQGAVWQIVTRRTWKELQDARPEEVAV